MRFHSFIVYAILLGSLLTVAAQDSSKVEKLSIQYKDGSVFQGQVVRQESAFIMLKIITGDTIKVDRSLATKITSSNDISIYRRGSYHLKTGFFGYTSLNIGGDAQLQATSQIELVIGRRLSERWSVGVGYGRTFSDAWLGGIWTDHIFKNLFGYGRYYLKNSRIRPYVDSKLGYGFAGGRNNPFVFDNHSGGINFQPGIGLHFASKRSFRWIIGIGQNLQFTKGVNTDQGPFSNPITANYRLWYNRTVFKIGLEFK